VQHRTQGLLHQMLVLTWALNLAGIIVASEGARLMRADGDDPLNPRCDPVEDDYADIRDVRVHALVYFGRREYVQILNAYLERDLKRNGGVLDTVQFALVKYTHEDIRYLAALRARNPDSYFIPPIEGGGWDVVLRVANEPGALYLKIDDDIVFISEGAIAELVREKLRKRFLFVSANVVNHGILSSVHQELAQLRWLVPPPPPPPAQPHEAGASQGPWTYQGDVIVDPRFRIEHTFYSDCIWRRWDCGALAHEVLLHRIKDGTLCAFDFGMYDFHAHGYATMSDGRGRNIDWSVNFFAFAHEDLSDIDWLGVSMDDEAEISTKHPRRRNEHAAALGRAIVAHFAFSVQQGGLRQNTSLLARYFELAKPLMQDNALRYYGGIVQPLAT